MISVILLTHNYAKYLPECLDSIMKNKSPLVGEIIIINDNSKDNTDQIVNEYESVFPRIRYFKKNFLSLNKSYNFAVSKSKFEFITKIDADDTMQKNFLHDFFYELKEKNYDFIYVNINIIDKFGNHLSEKKQKKNFINSYIKYPLGSGTIYKKNIWEKLGGFDENIKFQDDYDFWLKIKKMKNIKIGYLSKQGYNYRIHDKNMSKNKLKKNLTKIYVFMKNFI